MTTPIRFADLQKSPWPNGAGRKADIAAGHVGLRTLNVAIDVPYVVVFGHEP